MTETLKHGMNCPGLIPLGDDCTCGLKWRIKLQTEQTMHSAWRKRAEEAELELKERREAGYGAERAVAERIRQKSVEGWTPEHDAQHEFGELSIAAACYAVNAIGAPFQVVESRGPLYESSGEQVGNVWPWSSDWDKRDKHGRERSLEISAALIMAELDRIHAIRGK